MRPYLIYIAIALMAFLAGYIIRGNSRGISNALYITAALFVALLILVVALEV